MAAKVLWIRQRCPPWGMMVVNYNYPLPFFGAVALRGVPLDFHNSILKWKINMEPENHGTWKMIFLFNWVIFRFHENFPGCRKMGWDENRRNFRGHN